MKTMTLDLKRQNEGDDTDTESEFDPTRQEKLRRCLSCGEDFPSAWAGERVCKRCRSSSRWRQG